jgi:hypothetical protein
MEKRPMSAAAANQSTPLATTAPPSAIEQLYAARRKLAESIISKNDALVRLRDEASREAALIDEVTTIAAAETAEMRHWADGGCIGDAPTGKQAERKIIATKLAAAKATSSAARGALDDIVEELRRLHADHAQVDQDIRVAALDLMATEGELITKQYVAAVEATNTLMADLMGLRGHLAEQGRQLTDRGDHEAGRAYFLRATALSETTTRLEKEHFGATKAAVDSSAQKWSRRADALRKGPTS